MDERFKDSIWKRLKRLTDANYTDLLNNNGKCLNCNHDIFWTQDVVTLSAKFNTKGITEKKIENSDNTGYWRCYNCGCSFWHEEEKGQMGVKGKTNKRGKYVR